MQPKKPLSSKPLLIQLKNSREILASRQQCELSAVRTIESVASSVETSSERIGGDLSVVKLFDESTLLDLAQQAIVDE